MAGKKRTRRANGEAKNGKSQRRKNLSGTLEKRGEKWLARYYVYIDGIRKRKTKTLEAATVDQARAELNALLNDFAPITRERLLEKNAAELNGVREEIKATLDAQAKEDAKRRAEETDAKAITISGAWEHYEKSKKRPDSGPRTLEGYRGQYAAFVSWVTAKHGDKLKMRDFTPKMAEAFIDHIEKTKSRNTRNKYLTLLRTFWRVLRWNPDAQLTFAPWDGIRSMTLTPDTVNRKDLTPEEIERIANAIKSDENKATLTFTYTPDDGRMKSETWDLRGEFLSLLALGIYTGARLGDCATFKWGDIDLVRGTLTYKPQKTKRKYNREVTTPLHHALASLLASVPIEERKGELLPKIATMYKRESSTITNRFQKILRAAGIETDAKGENGTRTRTAAGFHSLRHFFASWLDNHGVNHALTNYLTCHEQGKVEATYYHGNAAALSNAVAILPYIEGLTDGANTAENAPTNAPCEKRITSNENNADATESRFRAFCEIVEKMSASELENALDYINTRKATMI